jgi:3-hydroxy-9,10-secoandrosta-1,3,5(10)-triene-9,17-dione monooxygenase
MTREQALAKARALAPALAGREQEAQALRHLPDASVRELHESGLLRILQPQRVGGAELEFGTLVEVCAEIARGSASTGWVYGYLASHHWMLGMWPRQAQDEVWGSSGASADALIAASMIFPGGRATAVEGGYRLSGHWGFCSGVDFCDWNILGGIVAGDPAADEFEYRMFLLPKSDYRIIDKWHTAGLVATGSREIETSDAFVPRHRTLAVHHTKGGPTPGSAVNTGPLYRIPVLATFGYVVAGVPLGIAQAALDIFTGASRSRLASYSGRKLADFATVQEKVAEAGALTDAARRVLTANCSELMQQVEAGTPDIAMRVRMRRDAAFAATLCRRAVDLLHEASGGAAMFVAHPMHRAFADMHAASTHIALSWDAIAATAGRVAMGYPADNNTL